MRSLKMNPENHSILLQTEATDYDADCVNVLVKLGESIDSMVSLNKKECGAIGKWFVALAKEMDKNK